MKLKILKEPYPFNNELKRVLISSFLFGVFIFLFLFIFQPFGLAYYQSGTKTLELVGYGFITTSILILNHLLFSFLFPKWFCRQHWTVGKNIFYTLYMFFCIGLGNLFYSYWLNYLDLNFSAFLFYQGITLLVGIFPVTLSTLYVYNKRLKQAVQEAQQLNSSIQPSGNTHHNQVEIPSQNKSENFSVELSSLLSIKSVENYIEVYYVENNELKKFIVRNTLKNTEEHFTGFDFIKKCHRSYLVNLEKVSNFTGNAQGLSLQFLEVQNFEVPVSRSFVKEIKAHLLK